MNSTRPRLYGLVTSSPVKIRGMCLLKCQFISLPGGVRRLVDEAFQRALRLVEENSDGLEILAEALEQREVLEAKEIRELMSGTGVPGGREPVLA